MATDVYTFIYLLLNSLVKITGPGKKNSVEKAEKRVC